MSSVLTVIGGVVGLVVAVAAGVRGILAVGGWLRRLDEYATEIDDLERRVDRLENPGR